MTVSRYSKAWVALVGMLAQVAMALPGLLDSGSVPAAWEPWLRCIVAVATVLGVYGVRNAPAEDGRHELGRDAAGSDL